MFGGVLWSGAGKLVSMCANFVITLLLAHVLTPSEYGAYFVALTTIAIAVGIGMLGMDQVVVRFVAMHAGTRDYTGIREVIVRCLRIVIIGALVTCSVFLWLGPSFFRKVLDTPSLAACIGVLVAWLFFATLQRQLAETFRGLNDIRLATLFGGVRNIGLINAVLVCIAMLILWPSGYLTLLSALLTMLGVSITVVLMATSALWLYLRQHEHTEDNGGDPQLMHLSMERALHEGWPLWLAMLTTVLNNMGSTWLAGAIDTSAHVALLGVAQRSVLLLVAPAVIVNEVLPPIISQLHASAQLKRMEQIVRSVSGLLLIPMTGLLVVLLFGGKPLLHLLFGTYYENAYPMLIVLCLGQVINIATGAWQAVLPMTGGRHQILSSSAISLFVQLVLGLALGYSFGVLGVAVAFCVSAITTNLIGMWMVRRQLGIWTCAALNWRTIREIGEMIMARLTRHIAWQKP